MNGKTFSFVHVLYASIQGLRLLASSVVPLSSSFLPVDIVQASGDQTIASVNLKKNSQSFQQFSTNPS
jgi:hypothetical protein